MFISIPKSESWYSGLGRSILFGLSISSAQPSLILKLVSFAGILLIVVGCGGVNHGNRVAVSGTVTKNGKPIQYANIVFEPVDGKSAHGAGGTVVKGKYNLSKESGPTPGHEYKITLMVRPAKFAPGTEKNNDKPASNTPESDKLADDKPETLVKTIKVPEKISGSLDIEFEDARVPQSG